MNPYENLEPAAFWKRAISDLSFWDVEGLSRPKHKIKRADYIATGGSCFAQHISRRLRASGYRFYDAEPPPPLLSPENSEKFGYGLYSARYGNVYTSTQLVQLYMRANRAFLPAEEFWLGENGRYYDPFRPSIEPDGFASKDELLAAQIGHLRAVSNIFRRVDVFVFTMGLTETWRSRADGAVYPTCPGTQAGTFDPAKYEFVNLTFEDIIRDMRGFIAKTTARNPKLRFVLTVSPVPLTATASGQHVLTATTYSKSVLRAVAGQLAQEFDNVDYFPSYEIITSPVFRGTFFEKNLRGIRPEGVDFVMNSFFKEFCEDEPEPAVDARVRRKRTKDEIYCDEQVLEAFAQ